jgi:hypothetical protein
MGDDLRKRLHEVLLTFAIGKLNPKQCAILGGVIATLQAIDNDTAAITWLVESGSRILNELRQAGDS